MSKKNKIILLMSSIIIIIFIHVFLIFPTFNGNTLDAQIASQYGSFIGGYIGTIISIGTAVLLFITLTTQQKALQKQVESFELEKFENKFFELVKLHRENVAEMSIGNEFGRKVFVTILREYRKILKDVDNIIIDFKRQSKFNNNMRLNMAYKIFFYGVGPNSSRMLDYSLQYDDEFRKYIIDTIQKLYCEEKNKSRNKSDSSPIPYGGHQSRLGHYYRHLYQTFMYIDEQKHLSQNQKYKYAKILRAQLSNHEIALLIFNVKSDLGTNWISNENGDDIITKYSLIKNLPRNFINEEKELNLEDEFPKIVFEYMHY